MLTPPPPVAEEVRPVVVADRSRARTLHRLLWSLLLVAVVTLTPRGTGWRWGDPLTELRWYATGLGSPTTVLELLGNLALLAVPAVLATRLWPRLAGRPWLVPLALAAGTAVETLQWLLPLGRVVSPVDALLNATGAVLAASVARRRRGAVVGVPPAW